MRRKICERLAGFLCVYIAAGNQELGQTALAFSNRAGDKTIERRIFSAVSEEADHLVILIAHSAIYGLKVGKQALNIATGKVQGSIAQPLFWGMNQLSGKRSASYGIGYKIVKERREGLDKAHSVEPIELMPGILPPPGNVCRMHSAHMRVQSPHAVVASRKIMRIKP